MQYYPNYKTKHLTQVYVPNKVADQGDQMFCEKIARMRNQNRRKCCPIYGFVKFKNDVLNGKRVMQKLGPLTKQSNCSKMSF
jgi:hypothetical protein